MVSHNLLFFWPNVFREENLWRYFSIYSYVKIRPSIMVLPCPGDHDLHKIESTLPDDTLTQVDLSGWIIF